MKISLFFFSGGTQLPAADGYDFFLRTIEFADSHGFEAVWMPERHFTNFGGLYPNPSLLAAAAAVSTEHLRLRAGSVILPLHDPLRVVEEWAVVDNLSRGRTEISFGSGWNANDFVFSPDHYTDRREWMWQNISLVRRLWRGEGLIRINGAGERVEVVPLPRPFQAELPVWITAQSDATFEAVGSHGLSILTNMNFTTCDQLTDRIGRYRKALQADTAFRGRVALMLHTFIGSPQDMDQAGVREALHAYLEDNLAMRGAAAQGKGLAPAVSDSARTAIIDRGLNRLFGGSSLLCDEETAAQRIGDFADMGVDELACLIDFGPDLESTLASLRRLSAVVSSI